jgi:hypothetical protein
MPNSVVITLTSAGLDTGPFNLYSNITSYSIPFATNILRNDLITGITVTVPTNTSTIKLESSNSTCSVYINLSVQNLPDCFCPAGYTVSNDNFNCYEEFTNFPLSQIGPYYTATGSTSVTYGNGGYRIYNVDDYNITGGSISGTYALNGTNYGPKVTPEEIFWSNRMNDTLIWVSGNTSWPNGDTGYPDFVSLCTVIEPTETKLYYIGVGADDDAIILVNGTEIINQSDSSVINHEIWKIYPVLLYAGPNNIEIKCYNRISTGGFGFEIYENSLTEISVATGTTMLNIIFTTENYKTGNISGGTEFCSNYLCPIGYTYDSDFGDCRRTEYLNCSTESECVCLTLTIDERDLLAATGNTITPVLNNVVTIQSNSKQGFCDGGNINITYLTPTIDYLCVRRTELSNLRLIYSQDDIIITGSTLFSTIVTGNSCTTNEDCITNYQIYLLNQQHLENICEINNVTINGNNLPLTTGAYPIQYRQDAYGSYSGGNYNVNVELSSPSGIIHVGTNVTIIDSVGNSQCVSTTGTTGNEILTFTSLVLNGNGLFTILCNDGPCATPTPTPTPTATPTPTPTPTNTPTPTPTPTNTPTPTPTPTPTSTPLPTPSYYLWLGTTSTYSTSGLSCSNYSTGTPYYTAIPLVSTGVRIYTNTSLTTPFNGGNQWIAVKLNGANPGYTIQVDTNGYVISNYNCP